jgi:hypothetical protein
MKFGSIYTYDSETKEQSKEWRHGGLQHPKKLKTHKSSKVLAAVFWDKDGILLVDYLEKGSTSMAKYYVALLDKMKQQLSPNIEASFQKESCFFKTMLPLPKWPLCTRNWQIFTLKF